MKIFLYCLSISLLLFRFANTHGRIRRHGSHIYVVIVGDDCASVALREINTHIHTCCSRTATDKKCIVAKETKGSLFGVLSMKQRRQTPRMNVLLRFTSLDDGDRGRGASSLLYVRSPRTPAAYTQFDVCTFNHYYYYYYCFYTQTHRDVRHRDFLPFPGCHRRRVEGENETRKTKRHISISLPELCPSLPGGKYTVT